jgi:hypothetical protein
MPKPKCNPFRHPSLRYERIVIINDDPEISMLLVIRCVSGLQFNQRFVLTGDRRT